MTISASTEIIDEVAPFGSLLASDIVTRAYRRLQLTDIADSAPSAAELEAGLGALADVLSSLEAHGIAVTTQTLAGDLTDDDDRVTGLDSVATISVGLNLSGTGIATGATVKEVLTDTSFRMSADATASGSDANITLTFLPMHPKYQRAVIALTAVRIAEDAGTEPTALVMLDAERGMAQILAGYIPDRKATFDRALAEPAGTWDPTTDLVL